MPMDPIIMAKAASGYTGEMMMSKMTSTLVLAAWIALAAGCGSATPEPTFARLHQPAPGVPVDGYPNYQERLMLLAVNRARAEPNSRALGTSGECGGDGSTAFAPAPPLVLDIAGSRAARFHCRSCLRNGGGLSHDSYCELKTDIAQTACDGALECACQPGSAHFNCTTGGGHGTDPWTRCARFGFSANGEVGAVQNSDGWAAVAAWVTECPNYEGHRRILLDADQRHSRIGLGFAGGSGDCWDRFYFGDVGSGAANAPRLPAGIHRPEHGSPTRFYLHVTDPGAGPASVQLVLDGPCFAMEREAGSAQNGTWMIERQLAGGCHRYWFLVRGSDGGRHVYPASGAWGCGDCADYSPQAPPAQCEERPDGGSDPADGADEAFDGEAAPPADGGSDDGGDGAGGQGGCGCATPAAAGGLLPALVLLLGLRRRQSSRSDSPRS